MLGPAEDALADEDGPAACPASASGSRSSTATPAAAEAGQHPARLLADRGRPGPGGLRADRPGGADRRAGQRLPLGRGAGRAAAGRRLPAAARAGLRRPRHVGEDRPEPGLQRLQVHPRGADRGHAPRRGRRDRAAGSRTPGPASRPRSCRASSSGSTGSREPGGGRTRGPASAWRWCRSWSSSTAGGWRSRAPSARGRLSR